MIMIDKCLMIIVLDANCKMAYRFAPCEPISKVSNVRRCVVCIWLSDSCACSIVHECECKTCGSYVFSRLIALVAYTRERCQTEQRPKNRFLILNQMKLNETAKFDSCAQLCAAHARHSHTVSPNQQIYRL